MRICLRGSVVSFIQRLQVDQLRSKSGVSSFLTLHLLPAFKMLCVLTWTSASLPCSGPLLRSPL